MRILDLQSAASSDPSALALDNNAHRDSEPIDIRFYGQIVGSETRLSGSWICMLLSIAVSHSRKNDIFDNLMVANIIQQGMEHVTSNGARISCVISRHSFSNFWRSRTRFGVEHQINGGNGFLSPEIDV